MDDHSHLNEKKSGLLSRLEDDRLSSLFKQYPFSTNLRWELIKRKLVSGDISSEEIANQSIYMKDRLSYFKEIEELTQSKSQDSLQSMTEDTQHTKSLTAADNKENVATAPKETPPEMETKPEIKDPLPTATEEEESGNAPEDPEAGREEAGYPNDAPSAVDGEEKQEVGIENQTTTTKELSPRKDFSTSEANSETAENEDDNSSPFVKWLRTVSDSNSGKKTYRGETFSREQSSVEESKKDIDQNKEQEPIKVKKNKKKKKGGKIKSKPPKELELQPDIATETLANLLASQGHHEEANEMYRLLSLKYPEKSSYFAAKIKKS